MSETATAEFASKFNHLAELRKKADEDKAAADASKEALSEYQAELYEELEEAGIRGRHTFKFGKFQRASTTYGQVLDKKTAIESLKKLGYADAIIEESIAKGRLNEIVRDLLEAGKPLPDGIGSYEQKRIQISLPKVKEAGLDV